VNPELPNFYGSGQQPVNRSSGSAKIEAQVFWAPDPVLSSALFGKIYKCKCDSQYSYSRLTVLVLEGLKYTRTLILTIFILC